MSEIKTSKTNGNNLKGFASMDVNLRKELASKGVKSAHAKGTAHEFNSEEAREVGKKGGTITSQDRVHMSSLGKKGGKVSGEVRR